MNENQRRVMSRRAFLRGACAGLGFGGLASQIFTLRLTSAALAQSTFTDYKALVCVFLYGGNDSCNTLIPYEGDPGLYAQPQNHEYYAALRGALAIPKPELAGTMVVPANTLGRSFALHPSLSGVAGLFRQGRAAVLANVGTLVEPTTRAAYFDHSAQLPPQLFAHNTQQELWQVSTADAIERIGWGGRAADALQAMGVNPDARVSMSISLANTNFFQVGRRVSSYALRPDGSISLDLANLGGTKAREVARAAFGEIMEMQADTTYSRRHGLQGAYADVTERALSYDAAIRELLALPTNVAPPPAENSLAEQLAMVAHLIEHAPFLGHQRQTFFVSMGGYDNHDGVIGPHGGLLADLDEAVVYFWNALGAIGQRDAVTLFTASDFGRTCKSNGNGSDHGWGGHHFVIGGAHVRGGRVFGQYPDLTINGDEDTGNGRYIPTTSVDAYSFELTRWLGVPLSEMTTIFPNLSRFLDPNNPSTHPGILV